MKWFAAVAAAAGVVGVLVPAPVEAQPPPNFAAGVALRQTEDISLLEHLSIITRRAMVPGSRVVAPLHTYGSALACDPDAGVALLGHHGSAALVREITDVVFAIYFRTVDQAVQVARQEGWCPPPMDESGATTPPPERWYLATTLPLADLDAVDHYLSLDIDAVEASIARSAAEERWRGNDWRGNELVEDSRD